MAKTNKTAAHALGRVKTAAVKAGKTGKRVAGDLVRTKPVRQAGKAVSTVGRRASALAASVADTVTGRAAARKRKRKKVVAAIVGAAVATAAGVGLTRQRKR